MCKFYLIIYVYLYFSILDSLALFIYTIEPNDNI